MNSNGRSTSLKTPEDEKCLSESHNEFLAAHYLNYFPTVKSFIFQPHPIEYEYGKKKHSYTPDFLVELFNGNWVYIEIKEEVELYSTEFKPIFQAKKWAVNKLSKQLILVTENQYLIDFKTDNIRSLLSICGYSPKREVCDLIFKLLNEHGVCKLDLISKQLDHIYSIEDIWRAIKFLILERDVFF